jgi:hypothetical protein
MRLFSENHVILVSNWALTKYRTSFREIDMYIRLSPPNGQV